MSKELGAWDWGLGARGGERYDERLTGVWQLSHIRSTHIRSGVAAAANLKLPPLLIEKPEICTLNPEPFA